GVYCLGGWGLCWVSCGKHLWMHLCACKDGWDHSWTRKEKHAELTQKNVPPFQVLPSFGEGSGLWPGPLLSAEPGDGSNHHPRTCVRRIACMARSQPRTGCFFACGTKSSNVLIFASQVRQTLISLL